MTLSFNSVKHLYFNYFEFCYFNCLLLLVLLRNTWSLLFVIERFSALRDANSILIKLFFNAQNIFFVRFFLIRTRRSSMTNLVPYPILLTRTTVFIASKILYVFLNRRYCYLVYYTVVQLLFNMIFSLAVHSFQRTHFSLNIVLLCKFSCIVCKRKAFRSPF